MQHVLRSAEGGLGVDDEIVAEQRPKEGAERFVLCQWLEHAGQAKLTFAECPFEPGDELAAEHAAQDLHRQEEAIAWTNPGFVIRGQTTCRDHAVDVWVVEQVLAPGVEHAEETDLSAQMFRISGDLQESRSAGSKQQGIQKPLVVEGQRSQRVRKREDHMYIGNSQEFSLAGGQPLVASVRPTLRTMAVAAGVVGDGHGMTAARTTVPVTAERCRAAAFDGREHSSVQPCQPRPLFLDEVFACRANDVGHLEGWPVHFCCFLRERLTLARSETASPSSGFAHV